MQPQIVINDELKDRETSFVISAWLKVAMHSKTFLGVKGALYYSEMSKMINNALEDKDTRFIIARNAEDEDQLYGCIVYSKDTILFCYVKGLYRELGLFNEMAKHLSESIEFYGIENSYSKILKNNGLRYNPFEFFKYK